MEKVSLAAVRTLRAPLNKSYEATYVKNDVKEKEKLASGLT